jgi:hypothetical protein
MAVVTCGCGLQGAQRDFGLHATAEQYVLRTGCVVVVFDYASFGGSDGEPRHWASPSRQLEDWRGAFAYATRTFPKAKLVLWGTSYS